MSYSSIIRELEASRRISADLALQRHQQQLQRSKIQKELESLRRSRKNYINEQIAQSRLQYEQKLKEDNEVSQEHLNRKKRALAQKAKMAQLDFQRQRQRLLQQRNNHDQLDKQYRVIDKALADIQLRSKLAQEDQQRKLFQLNARKATLLKLIEQSKQRQVFHYAQSKRISII